MADYKTLYNAVPLAFAVGVCRGTACGIGKSFHILFSVLNHKFFRQLCVA